MHSLSNQNIRKHHLPDPYSEENSCEDKDSLFLDKRCHVPGGFSIREAGSGHFSKGRISQPMFSFRTAYFMRDVTPLRNLQNARIHNAESEKANFPFKTSVISYK